MFAPFPENRAYFGDAGKTWMINFRVRALDPLVSQRRAAGIAVDIRADNDPDGRFARLHDPERNPIEPWEPAPPGAK